MEPSPLRLLAAPKYPTRGEVLATPELLQKASPTSWHRDELLVAVAAAAVLSQSACVREAPGQQRDAGQGEGQAPRALRAQTKVAPVFEYGQGYAAVGCMAVAPPASLSEEQALKVIRDEASKRDLALERLLSRDFDPNSAPAASLAGFSGPLVPDLVDSERGIALEFVDRLDAVRYSGETRFGSGGTISMKKGAENISRYVREHGTTGRYFVAFYDPATRVPLNMPVWSATDMSPLRRPRLEEAMAPYRALSEEDLRAQVKDFLDWLQAQGAL